MPASESNKVWPIVLGLVAVPIVGAVIIVATDDGPPERPKVNREPERVPAPSPIAPTAVTVREPDPEPEPVEEPEEVVEEQENIEPSGGTDEGTIVAAKKIQQARRIENTDPRGARRLLREALQADPDNPRALEQLAVKTLIDEQKGGARDLAKRCQAVNSSSQWCQKVLRLAPDETPELAHFVKGIKECAKTAPDNVSCVAGMVGYHLNQGDVTKAAELTGRLTQLAPGSPETLLAQGRIQATKEDYGGALKYFESACEISKADEACIRADALREEGW